MERLEQLVKALRYCVNARNCEKCGYRLNNNSVKCRIQRVEDAAAAIEALLKENKELIEDHPEMVEADGHWEWRKPNGEVLMPKRVEVVRCGECKWYDPLDRTIPFFCPVMDCVTGVMEDDFCSRGERRAKMEAQDGK